MKYGKQHLTCMAPATDQANPPTLVLHTRASALDTSFRPNSTIASSSSTNVALHRFAMTNNNIFNTLPTSLTRTEHFEEDGHRHGKGSCGRGSGRNQGYMMDGEATAGMAASWHISWAFGGDGGDVQLVQWGLVKGIVVCARLHRWTRTRAGPRREQRERPTARHGLQASCPPPMAILV